MSLNKLDDLVSYLTSDVSVEMLKFATIHKASKVYMGQASCFVDSACKVDVALSLKRKEAEKFARQRCGTVLEYDLQKLVDMSDIEFEDFIADPIFDRIHKFVRGYRKAMGQTTIYLPLNKRWFDMIATGAKKEEYREVKGKYIDMFCELLNVHEPNNSNDFCIGFHLKWPEKYDRVVFTLGYPKSDSEVRRLVFNNPCVRIGTGKPEWGARPGKKYFVITWEDA